MARLLASRSVLSPAPRILPCRRVAVCRLSGMARACAGRPERLVLGLIVAPVLERVLGDHRAGEASPGGALQLLRALPDIVQADHRDALEPGRVGAAEVGEPVVVRAEDRGHERGVGHLEVEETLRRVEHLAGHPVEAHVRQVLLGVVAARRHVLEPTERGDGLGGLEPSAGVGDEPDPGEDLVRLDHELVGAVDPHHPGRPVAEGPSMRVVHRSGGSNTCESEDRMSAEDMASSFPGPGECARQGGLARQYGGSACAVQALVDGP